MPVRAERQERNALKASANEERRGGGRNEGAHKFCLDSAKVRGKGFEEELT
jgi:hypothetical protein